MCKFKETDLTQPGVRQQLLAPEEPQVQVVVVFSHLRNR